MRGLLIAGLLAVTLSSVADAQFRGRRSYGDPNEFYVLSSKATWPRSVSLSAAW